MDDLAEWEKTVEQLELCDGVLSEADRRMILSKKIPTTDHSSLVLNLRKVPTYLEMKAELESEIVFLMDCGPGDVHKAGHAHRAAEQSPPEDEDQQSGSTADDDEEGILELDFTGLPAEQAEPILLAARQAGLRVRAPFKRPTGGNRFQPRPKSKFPAFKRPSADVPSHWREGVEVRQLRWPTQHPQLPDSFLEENKRKCFNCGEEAHRAKDCKKPDRRKQQHGGKAMLGGPPASTS